MMYIVEQTKEEKIAMYMKCTKRELIEMVINCNMALSAISEQQRMSWVNMKLESVHVGNHDLWNETMDNSGHGKDKDDPKVNNLGPWRSF